MHATQMGYKSARGARNSQLTLSAHPYAARVYVSTSMSAQGDGEEREMKRASEKQRGTRYPIVERRKEEQIVEPENCQSKVPRNERTSRGAASQTSSLCVGPRMFELV